MMRAAPKAMIRPSAPGYILAVALAGGCSGGGPTDLVVSDIAGQTVVRNALTPRTVDVGVEVDGPRQAFDVSLTSDDASVVSDEMFTCTENPCPISFTPSPDKSADVTVTLSVDADGALGETAFPVSVIARLVRSRLDGDPAPADTLRDVVGKADEGDVVAFDTEGEFSAPRTIVLERPIQLGKDLTIEGHGTEAIAISGDMATGLFVVDDNSRVAFRDFTLTRSMQTDPGGAVNVAATSALTVEGCHFTENRGVAGAAIYSTEGDVVLDGASFTDNVASMSGAVVFAQGGSLRLLGGTAVADNTGGLAGAIEVQDGALTVEDSVFERNLQADDRGEGGAIRVAGENASATIDGTLFEENAAFDGGAVAVVLATASVSDSTFRDNSAELYGAGLFATDARVAVLDSAFETNRATAGAGISGDRSMLEIDQCTFQNNEATYPGEGAAIDASGFEQSFLLRDSRVLGTIGGGAAVFVEGPIATIEDVEISGSRAEGRGGGLYMSPRGDSVVRRARIVNNRTEDVAARGGGILARQPFTIEDCEIENNHSDGFGGGISAAVGPSAPLVIRNTLISGNTVQDGLGGGFFVEGRTLVQLEMGTRLVANRTEKGNGGGAYVAFHSVLQIEGGDVGGPEDEDEGNIAVEGWGGGIYVSDGGTAELTMGTRLMGNGALEGGGAYVEADGELAIRQSEVGSNTAFLGGGIYARGGLELSETTVEGNLAFERGGGIVVDSPGAENALVQLGDAQTQENRAVERGAGLWVNRGKVRASESVLIALNDVDEDKGGGGIYVEVDGDVCSVPLNRVFANRAGPSGLENNIEPMLICP